MCIRDSNYVYDQIVSQGELISSVILSAYLNEVGVANTWFCLLYTSDAADERSSVDLGGRRIIKKKK